MLEKLDNLSKKDFEATKNLLKQLKEATGIKRTSSLTSLDFTNWLENR